jgi:hypothetical protein
MKPFRFESETTPWRVMLPKSLTHGKRKAKYFATKEDALKFCRQAEKPGFTLDGFVPAVPKSKQEEFGVAIRQFAALYDGKISDAYAAHEKLQKLQNIRPATVREAVEEFQACRKTQIRKVIQGSTWDTDRWRLVKFLEAFERCQLSDLMEADIWRFFDSVTGDKRSIYSSLNKFFKWAKRHQLVVVNPMSEIEPKEIGTFGVRKDIYSVETFERMLRVAAGLESVKHGGLPTNEFKALLPLFVLGGFCGLRPCESRRLTRNAESIRWSDLYFDRGFIEIRDEAAKSTKREDDTRHIETAHYLQAAKAWLELCPATDNGFVVPWTKRKIQDLKRAFKAATGIRLLENGLRNSFASYALTYDGLASVGKLALEMGDSEAVCKRYYIRTLLPGSGRAWFNLRPAIGNVIQMSAVA